MRCQRDIIEKSLYRDQIYTSVVKGNDEEKNKTTFDFVHSNYKSMKSGKINDCVTCEMHNFSGTSYIRQK